MIEYPQNRMGLLIVVSGPSGTGKTTLCKRLCEEGEAVFSVSCTTRAPRVGEVNGRDYHFLSESEFLQKVEDGAFFEYAQVHGNGYGTLKSAVKEQVLSGKDVLLDIDIQGAEQVRACDDAVIQAALVDLFVLPPSVTELQNRLFGRGTDAEEIVKVRMDNAVNEMKAWPSYRHVLVSGSREDDYTRFKSLILAERMRTALYQKQP